MHYLKWPVFNPKNWACKEIGKCDPYFREEKAVNRTNAEWTMSDLTVSTLEQLS